MKNRRADSEDASSTSTVTKRSRRSSTRTRPARNSTIEVLDMVQKYSTDIVNKLATPIVDQLILQNQLLVEKLENVFDKVSLSVQSMDDRIHDVSEKVKTMENLGSTVVSRIDQLECTAEELRNENTTALKVIMDSWWKEKLTTDEKMKSLYDAMVSGHQYMWALKNDTEVTFLQCDKFVGDMKSELASSVQPLSTRMAQLECSVHELRRNDTPVIQHFLVEDNCVRFIVGVDGKMLMHLSTVSRAYIRVDPSKLQHQKALPQFRTVRKLTISGYPGAVDFAFRLISDELEARQCFSHIVRVDGEHE
jgi:hypothetical protein